MATVYSSINQMREKKEKKTRKKKHTAAFFKITKGVNALLKIFPSINNSTKTLIRLAIKTPKKIYNATDFPQGHKNGLKS